MEALYPKGTQFKIKGLVTNTELNGKIGVCNGIYLNDKLGFKIAELNKEVAIKPKNLQRI